MLQSIRERAQGWIAWAIVILIAIPFALWGIQSYFGGGAERVVATVDGVDITQRQLARRYQATRIQLREQLGAGYDPALFDDAQLRREVLDAMIREAVLLTASRELGLRASDEEIRLAILANPAFHLDGRFDNEAYEQALAIQGLTAVQFEEELRRRLVGSQLRRALLASELVTDSELGETVRLLEQEREVSFVRVVAADLVAEEPPSDAEARAYYETHSLQFQTPEMVKVEYLVLNEETISAAAPLAGEQELRQLYETETARFMSPERRVVRHILVTFDPDDEAAAEAARQAVAEARERILGGEELADVAREVSEDPESAEKGGLIGEIEAGMMDPAFDAAAFDLAEGVVSDPIRTPFGYHLIQVDEVIPKEVRPFEEVKDELAAEAARKRFESLYFDWAERLATLAYEAADTLTPAAEALGLQLRTSDWIPRTGGEGLLGEPRVMSAAFSDEVLRQGLNSDLIEPEQGVLESIVLRVTDHREATVPPLEDVRDEIEAALRIEQSRLAAEEVAGALIEQLDQGQSLEEVAGEWPRIGPQRIGRNAPALPVEVRTLAFTLPRPAEGRASYGRTPLANGDVAVVAVTDVQDGRETDDEAATARRQQADAMARQVAEQYFAAMLDEMTQRAKVKRNLESTAEGE